MTATAQQQQADRYRVSFVDPWPPSVEWSVDRYRKAHETGVIGEDEPVELLYGKIVYKMGSNPPHAACIQLLMEYFFERYYKKYGLRSENAIQLSDTSLPEPDFAVVTYRADHYAHTYPQGEDVVLIIEVADSSLAFDRIHKASAYALAGISEYWIVNLRDRRLELHLSPDLTDGVYMSVNHYGEDDTVDSPFAGTLQVARLLPPVLPLDE